MESLVKHKNWIWLAGMKAVGRKGAPEAWFRFEGEPQRKLHGDWSQAIPDIEDHATIGCLLELARRVRKDHNWLPSVVYHDPEPDWVIEMPSHERQTLYGSYVSAIIAAIMIENDNKD